MNQTTKRLWLVSLLETLGVALLVFLLAWALVRLASRKAATHPAPTAVSQTPTT